MFYILDPPSEDTYIHIGMINISANFYLESTDEGWEKYQKKHHFLVSVFPEEGYPRQKKLDAARDEDFAYKLQQEEISKFPEEIIDGVVTPIIPKDFKELPKPVLDYPKEQNDYNIWKSELPTKEIDEPFCNHAIQFDADELVDDENSTKEEKILWCMEWALAQTHLNYLQDDLFCEKGTTAKKVNKNINYVARQMYYAAIKDIDSKMLTPIQQMMLAKTVTADTKIKALKTVDFTAVKTIASYKVRK